MTGAYTFHGIVQLREAPARVDAPPLASAVDARAPTRLPFEGDYLKWWAVEARFDRALTRREARRLETAYGPWLSPAYGHIGRDGMVWGQWWNKWPSAHHDGAELVRVMQRTGVPGVVRAAPFGRDCVGGWSCAGLGGDERCDLGRAWSCSPVLTRADWIAVWPTAWRLS